MKTTILALCKDCANGVDSVTMGIMETNDSDREPALNAHNKDEYPPMHTTEHILNQTMIRMFGCGRSRSAHIERKKSKCDYALAQCPSANEVSEIERRVNEAIDADLPVTAEFMRREEASSIVDLARLTKDASETLRIVRVGEYDVCACIGAHASARMSREPARSPRPTGISRSSATTGWTEPGAYGSDSRDRDSERVDLVIFLPCF